MTHDKSPDRNWLDEARRQVQADAYTSVPAELAIQQYEALFEALAEPVCCPLPADFATRMESAVTASRKPVQESELDRWPAPALVGALGAIFIWTVVPAAGEVLSASAGSEAAFAVQATVSLVMAIVLSRVFGGGRRAIPLH